ncbi:MAG: intradiol ring-cleavage dioxygenase [Parvularculaceae bacterium]
MQDLGRRSIIVGLGAAAATAAFAAPPARARRDLYHCEGCEAVAERALDTLSATAVIAGPDEPGERLIAEGVVYQSDGVTPAAGVVIYAHHTNHQGLYANGSGETEEARRHGRLRGWVKTGADGLYRFETVKPEPYPDMTMSAHIHLMIGEPGRRPYYVDDIVFEGEHDVTDRYRREQELRGGSGIVRLKRNEAGVLLARRDIVLERHPD